MVIKKNKMKRKKWWLKLIDSTAFEVITYTVLGRKFALTHVA